MKEGFQNFSKGLDRRTAFDRAAADSFYALSNVRLYARGDTGYVVPGFGYENKTFTSGGSPVTISGNFVAISRWQNYLLLLEKSGASSPYTFKFYIVDATNVAALTQVFTATYTATGASTDEYRFVVFGNLIFISPHNKFAALYDGSWALNDVISTTPLFTLANSVSSGNLEVSQFYWYKVRYVYRDGHTTRTSYAKGITTDSYGSVTLTIDTVDDLESTSQKADIEIYRSTKGQPFQLIGREQAGTGSTVTFVDNGKPVLDNLTEEVYTWPTTYQSHAQVRDRYVRANVSFLDNRMTKRTGGEGSDFANRIDVQYSTSTAATDSYVLPRNAEVEIYAKFRFTDGTESFHYKVDSTSTSDSGDTTLQYKLLSAITGADTTRTVKEVAFYARYQNKQRPASSIHTFKTLEIQNINLPSIRSNMKRKTGHYLESLEPEKPVTPKIFFGYKQICINDDTAWNQLIYDSEWDYDATATPATQPVRNNATTIMGAFSVTNKLTVVDDNGGIGYDIELEPYLDPGYQETVLAAVPGIRVGDSFSVSYSPTTVGVSVAGATVTVNDQLSVTFENSSGVAKSLTGVEITIVVTPSLLSSTPTDFVYLQDNAGELEDFNLTSKYNGDVVITSTERLLKLYRKKYNRISGSDDSTIYEMAALDSLKELARRGELYIKLNTAQVQLASTVSNERFESEWVKVIGIEDTSEQYEQYRYDSNYIFGSPQNHLYFVLEAGTIYDKIDNASINRDKRRDYTNQSGIAADYDNVISNYTNEEKGYYDPLVTFEISSIINQSTDTQVGGYPVSITGVGGANEYLQTLSYYSPQAVPDQFTPLVYLGSVAVTGADTGWKDPDNTGFKKRLRNYLTYNELASDAIYETLVREEDLKTLDFSFPNQLVWSEQYAANTDASRVRNFNSLNFYNLSSQHGPIKTIREKDNVLYAFCETGVAALAVGEVMTVQTDQSVRVGTGTLLNSEVWIFRNLKNVEPATVVSAENRLFFFDGVDVWMHTDQWQNITNGALGELAGPYSATFDVFNKEYRLQAVSNIELNGPTSARTYTYNLETGIWTGPHTLVETSGVSIANEFYTIQGTALRRNNRPASAGFNGVAIPMAIYSVANTLGDFSVVKLWRKFILDIVGSHVFFYGTTDDGAVSGTDSKTYNGLVEYGVKPAFQNKTELYWGVSSSDPVLKFKGLSFLFSPRLRR